MSSDNPQGDSRPQPRYGELAPEGWIWEPPTDDKVAPASPPPPTGLPSELPRGLNAPGVVPEWDRPVTLGLLILGLFATFLTISTLNAIPEAIQVLYSQQDLGTYNPAPSVSPLLLAGGITQAVLWLVTAGLSTLLLVRGRRAFYVPLIAGVASVVVIFVFLSIVLTTDPTLLDFYSRP